MDLNRFAGRWRGSWRTWMRPDELYGESAMDATVEVLLGGKAALVRYRATLDGEVDGLALLGATEQGTTVSWLDTWHTSGLVMVSQGPAADDRIEVSTTYGAGEETWRWSSVYLLDDHDRLVIRHHNEGPQVPRYLGVEVVLERTGPGDAPAQNS